MMMLMKIKTVTHLECHCPQLPFFLESMELVDAPPDDFLPLLSTISPSVKVRFFCQRVTARLWHWPFLHIKSGSCLWFGFSTYHRCDRLRQRKGRLLLSQSQRPVNLAIKANIIRRNSVLEVVKGNCEAQTSQCCLEAELKRYAKI